MGMKHGDDSLPDGGDPQLAGLYRTAAGENPPGRLDAAIQAAARRAVGARPQAAGASWLRAWRVPLSIAAVLVMSVSMVTLTVRQKGGPLLEPPLTASVPVPRSEPATAPTVAESATAARPAAPASKSAVASAARKGAAGDVAETARPSPPAMPDAETAVATTPALQPPVFAPPAAPPAESRVAAAQEERSAPPVRPLAKASPAAAPEATSVEAQALRRDRAAGVAADAALPASALVRELDTQPPEKWLEKILGLRQQGRAQEAHELLAEFRKRYPNHSLPPSLR